MDIESKIIFFLFVFSIFCLKYYDVFNFLIYILNKNEDIFIRCVYYGGYIDIYKLYGEDFYYYDVNFFYFFVMKEFLMLGGEFVWYLNLESKDLDSMFGFIEVYVVCLKIIKKFFFFYCDKNNIFFFLIGEFVGVYYIEELKYVRGLGYMVFLILGYFFKRMESLFRSFVSLFFESRLDVRKLGNEVMVYVYKILMNFLYGRFGINFKSMIIEVCDEY